MNVHNELAGHHGVEMTFDKLFKMGNYWPHMREMPFLSKDDLSEKANLYQSIDYRCLQGQEMQNLDISRLRVVEKFTS